MQGVKRLSFLFLPPILVAFLYAGVLRAPFVYDDKVEIIGNRTIRHMAETKALLTYNVSRPLLITTFAFDFRHWKYNPLPYRVENLFIHTVVCMLVFFIVSRVSRILFPGDPIFPAAAASILFAVHPLFVESVTYIASRSSSLCTLFFLLSTLSFVLFLEGKGKVFSVLSIFLWILSLLTKEEGITLPVALMIVDLAFFTSPREFLRVFPKRYLPFFLLLLLAFAGRYVYYGTLGPSVWPRSMKENIFTQVEVILRYLFLFIFPKDLSIYHDHPTVIDPWNARTLFSILFLLLFVSGAILLYRPWRPLFFGVFWFLVTLSPTSSIVPLKENMAEHRVYIGGLGVITVFAFFLFAWRRVSRFLPVPLLFLWAIPLSLQTRAYNRVWMDEEALWRHAVSNNPVSAEAHYGLGDALRLKGRVREAMEEYRMAARYRSDYADAYNNIGICLVRLGSWEEGERYFLKALNMDPFYFKAHNNLGSLYLQRGEIEKAKVQFERALSLRPNNFFAHYSLGNIYYTHLKDRVEAARHYEEALRLDPYFSGAEELKKRILEATW